MNRIGFVRNAFVQFIIFSFTGSSFSGICLFQIRHGVFPFLCFFINSIGIGFGLSIENGKVSPHTMGLDYVVSGLRCIIVNSFRFYFPCYRYITTRGDITSRKAFRSQFSTDFHVSDSLFFICAYNQITTAGNVKSRAIGFDLRIESNDIFTYRIAGRYIITAGKGIIHDALHADDFIFSSNIGLGNDFFTVDGRLGSQGTFDQSIAIHVQVATAVQAARIDGTAYIGVVAYADRIGHTGRAGSEFTAYIRILSPGEAGAQKSCCHQHGCCQFLQSLSCGFALGVALGDFRCHHIGVLCFAPDDFVDLIHGVTLL